MLGWLVGTGSETEDSLVIVPVDGHDVCEFRFSFGDCASLVENDGVEGCGRLECFGVSDEDAVLGRLPESTGHTHRDSQSDGTGTRDNEHRDSCHNGERHTGFRAEVKPREKCENGDDHHCQDEITGDDAREPSDWRLTPHRVLDKRDNLGKSGVLPNFRGPEFDALRRVYRRSDYLVAFHLIDRQTLAGNHRLVYGRLSFDDTVYRDSLSWPDHDAVTDFNFLDRNLNLFPITDDAGGLRLQVEELFDCLARLVLRFRFQGLPKDDQCDNNGRDVVERFSRSR